jgi:enamine deaminase RidA (YjgF/YER057c/UK114 family)
VKEALEVLQPEGWPRPSGYANGIAASGRLVFVAGQVGWNPETCQFETDDFVAQTTQALRNIAAVLRAAGAEPRHVVRLTWYITDKAAYLAAQREIGLTYREVMGRHYPAMSVAVVAGLVEGQAKVEIEATAVVQGGQGVRHLDHRGRRTNPPLVKKKRPSQKNS